jgi:hypothetical protein
MGGNKRGSVLRSLTCHYCGERAEGEDHIVPRADLPKPLSKLPYWFRANDVVPACQPCNGDKAWFRSDCVCSHCTWAWSTAHALFLPEGYTERGWVAIQQNPTIAMPLAVPRPDRSAYPGTREGRSDRESQALSN